MAALAWQSSQCISGKARFTALAMSRSHQCLFQSLRKAAAADLAAQTAAAHVNMHKPTPMVSL